MFGSSTGNCFTELKAQDGNKNGWIDKNDFVCEQLSIQTKDSKGSDRLSSLKESNAAALFLSSVNSPKRGQNQLQTQICASSVCLSEEGQAGVMQQIDLAA